MVLLDVGPSMHRILPDVEKVCSMLVQKKVNSSCIVQCTGTYLASL